ncbi:MAG: efflux RND transporter periplasmic adaptor subunit [Hyphomicrobiaceae bacterium]
MRSLRATTILAVSAYLVALVPSPVVPSAAFAQTAQKIPVVVMAAETTMFRDRVEALGTLRANESVAITAVVADTVSAIKFEDGDRVKKGQVLAEMATAEEKALLDEARSTLEEAKSQFDRAKSLTDRRLTAESVMDQRRRDLETARARVSAMEARLADRVLTAPFDGRLGLRTVSPGALVSPGDVIARIEDDSVMKLDFSVPSTFISALRPGLDIIAKARGFDDETFEGKVASIDNRIDENTRTVRVRAVIPNPNRRLVPGLLMSINLYKAPRMSVAVREETLVPIGRDTYVFIVDEKAGTVERRRIETGARRPGVVEVTSGLEAGVLVVSDGTIALRPGAAVNIVRRDKLEERRIEAPGDRTGAAPRTEKPAGRS